MKKSKKSATGVRRPARRSIKPTGRSPVIAVRVSGPLYERIKATAESREQSMSETMADLINKGLEWTEGFGDHLSFFRREREEVQRMIVADIRKAMKAKGWMRRFRSPYWIDPDALDLRGFKTDAAGFTSEEQVNAELDAIENSARKVRAKKRETDQ
jgi:hypothetical protein